MNILFELRLGVGRQADYLAYGRLQAEEQKGDGLTLILSTLRLF
jgi:hypothetical protein